MMRLKILRALALVALLSLVVYLVYLWATYVSEATDTGTVYGLQIGDSKSTVYEKLPQVFQEVAPPYGRVSTLIPTAESSGSERGEGSLMRVPADEIELEALMNESVWKFYMSESYRDSLTLTFCGDSLCRVYRHRQNFELP